MAERWGEFLTDAPELPFSKVRSRVSGSRSSTLAVERGACLCRCSRPASTSTAATSPRTCSTNAGAGQLRPARPSALCPTDACVHLPRKYRTIYICDSFGLAGSRDNDLATLRRCYAHLEDGGALVFSVDAEYTEPESWDRWLPEARQALPEPWPEDAPRRVAADGSEHLGRFRTVALDPLNQTYTSEVQLEKWRDGALVDSEATSCGGTCTLRAKCS